MVGLGNQAEPLEQAAGAGTVGWMVIEVTGKFGDTTVLNCGSAGTLYVCCC